MDTVEENIRKEFAIARLLRDLKEINDDPNPTIFAQPLNSNFFEWHANIIGPPGTDYTGVCFHLMIVYPFDYPMHPPKVKLLTTVHRDHVFGEWICLDMLQSWLGFDKKKYTGWSTAYTTLSILLQLQSFIFEPETAEWTNDWQIKKDCLLAANYRCVGCHHDMFNNKPFPWASYMQTPLNKDQVKEKYDQPMKRAIDIEAEMKVKAGKNIAAISKAMYDEDAERTKQRMKQQIELNRRKLEAKNNLIKQQKEAALLKSKQQSELVDKERYIPGWDNNAKGTPKIKKNNNNNNDSKQGKQEVENGKTEIKVNVKVPKERKFSEDDQVLNVIWNTKMSPLASTFVPRNRSSLSVNNNNNNTHQSNGHSHKIENGVHHKENIDRPFNFFEDLPAEILYAFMVYLTDLRDLSRLSRVSRFWKSMVRGAALIERKESICFHSKLTWENDTLGVGVSLNLHPKTSEVQFVTSHIELLSHTAFYKEQVRQSVWGEPFTHWLPLYINKHHSGRSLKVLKPEIEKICKKFTPWLAVDLYAKLMNTMVVSVMDGNLHASIVALQGYCYFHRMLIALVDAYPELKDIINQKVKDFINSEDCRHKSRIPSIGDFLPLLTVSDYTWAHLAVPVVKETMTRNVLWIAKKYPSLGAVGQDIDSSVETSRAKKSFEASTTSLRLIMFHVMFLTSIAKVGKLSTDEVARAYDGRYGRPTEVQQNNLQKGIFKIQAVADYKDYFVRVKLPKPTDDNVSQILRECVLASSEKRYHRYSNVAFKPKPKKVIDNKKPKRAALNTDDLY